MARELCSTCYTLRNSANLFSFPETGVICKSCIRKEHKDLYAIILQELEEVK
jgi:hypothetical protein